MSEVQRTYETGRAYAWVRQMTDRELHAELHLSTGDTFGVTALAALRDWRHDGSAG